MKDKHGWISNRVLFEHGFPITNEITNYNCAEMCVEETCSKKYTRYDKIKIQGIEIIIAFCDKHAGIYENTRTKGKEQ